jgi:hypothetical protein
MSQTQTHARCPESMSLRSEADNMLRDMAFVLQMTQRVRNSMGKNRPCEMASSETILPSLPATVPC